MAMRPVDWLCFFRPGTNVMALPSWKQPRLLLPTRDSAKVRNLISRFFDVRTIQGRVYRAIATVLARTGCVSVKKNRHRTCAIDPFLENLGIEFDDIVILVGRPSPIQKIKIVLLDAHDKPVGYIKYAERELAQMRVRHEYNILCHLPEGLGPRPLKIGRILNGTGLLLAPIHGLPVEENKITPPDEVLAFQERLVVERNKRLEDHPWIRDLTMKRNFPFKEWLQPLVERRWDVVIQHGDFVPWNLLRDESGNIVAVDWEFANLKGFPYLDIVYYLLQTSALMYKWQPKRAFLFARDYLVERFSLSKELARSLVRLAAFEAHWITAQNGRDDNWPLQKWRQEVWEVQE